MKSAKKSVRVTVRINSLANQRMMAVADDLKLNKSRLLCYLIDCFLCAYDTRLLSKFSPIAPEYITEVFQIKENKKDVERALAVIQRYKADRAKKPVGRQSRDNVTIEDEVRQMFAECEDKGKELVFGNDINRRY